MLKITENQKTPRERVLEFMDKIILGELEVESISIERFKSEDTGIPFLQVCIELTQNV